MLNHWNKPNVKIKKNNNKQQQQHICHHISSKAEQKRLQKTLWHLNMYTVH